MAVVGIRLRRLITDGLVVVFHNIDKIIDVAVMFSNCGLTIEDKLDAIRQLDLTGTWQTLDDPRYCTVCKKLFTGRQIEVVGGARGSGPLRLLCPTPKCDSSPADWKSSAAFRGRLVWRVLAVTGKGSESAV